MMDDALRRNSSAVRREREYRLLQLRELASKPRSEGGARPTFGTLCKGFARDGDDDSTAGSTGASTGTYSPRSNQAVQHNKVGRQTPEPASVRMSKQRQVSLDLDFETSFAKPVKVHLGSLMSQPEGAASSEIGEDEIAVIETTTPKPCLLPPGLEQPMLTTTSTMTPAAGPRPLNRMAEPFAPQGESLITPGDARVGAEFLVEQYMVTVANLPKEYTLSMLVCELRDAGFLRSRDYDMLYLNECSGEGLGVCFINFLDATAMLSFEASFQQKWMRHGTAERPVETKRSTAWELAEVIMQMQQVEQADTWVVGVDQQPPHCGPRQPSFCPQCGSSCEGFKFCAQCGFSLKAFL